MNTHYPNATLEVNFKKDKVFLAIFRHFSWNFENFENFYKCLHFSRGKKYFFSKSDPNMV